MSLVRLIYTSSVSDSFSSPDLEDILSTARTNNEQDSVTGALYFSRKMFLQCLEGSRSKVNNIYQKIHSDNRHTNLEIISYKDIQHREFADWSMGYIPETKMTGKIIIKYSSTPVFEPYDLSAESALNLLIHLKKLSLTTDQKAEKL